MTVSTGLQPVLTQDALRAFLIAPQASCKSSQLILL